MQAIQYRLVKAYDGIAVEKLNIAGLLKTKLFSKKMSQQRWGSLISYWNTKESWCPLCGGKPSATPPPTVLDAGIASRGIFRCEQCGLSICRDHNAAINVCARGYPTWDPWGRVGHDLVFPDAVRSTNLCCKTSFGSGRAMLADTAEQYHLDALSI